MIFSCMRIASKLSVGHPSDLDSATAWYTARTPPRRWTTHNSTQRVKTMMLIWNVKNPYSSSWKNSRAASPSDTKSQAKSIMSTCSIAYSVQVGLNSDDRICADRSLALSSMRCCSAKSATAAPEKSFTPQNHSDRLQHPPQDKHMKIAKTILTTVARSLLASLELGSTSKSERSLSSELEFSLANTLATMLKPRRASNDEQPKTRRHTEIVRNPRAGRCPLARPKAE
mmetsp:Transcript_34539/g.82860  ORF Transcript_34539/g.82860 Transcript_34539/m.82860 type:complete len:228 (+) Transcript_34539:439-1122(+)